MKTLEKITKRDLTRLLVHNYLKLPNNASTSKTTFELLNDFTKLYDLTSGNDRLLVEYMMNEIGYFKPESGCGWSYKGE